MKTSLAIFLCLLFLTLSVYAQSINDVKLIVEAGRYDRKNCVVSTSVLNFSSEQVTLFEEVGRKKVKVDCQLQREGDKTTLYWILKGDTPAGSIRSFILKSAKKKKNENLMVVDESNGILVLKANEQPILQYNSQIIYPPKGVDSAFKRSGFVHPVYSPSGNVLTNIQPKDHYHHYGMWNPWTRVEYAGKMYDLWNLGDKRGTVKFNKVLDKQQGDVFASFKVRQDHYIMSPSGEKQIMDESCSITAYNIGDDFLWDFKSTLHPNTSLPVILKAYRYAGFSFRATADWKKENCEMFTSEGNKRQEIDGKNARWIYLTGQCPSGRSGILFLGHPENHNAPEPLRIWDENANYGRGDAFVNFAPTKNEDWALEPDQNYSLRYRMITYDGEMTQERANRLWDEFAYPPTVQILID
jgi:hypothetical protein